MKWVMSVFFFISLLIPSTLFVYAQEVEVGDKIIVTPDGVYGYGIEITPEGIKIGNVKVKTDGESDEGVGQYGEREGRVYRGANFVGVDLSGESFRGSRFHGGNFVDSNLSNVDFTNAKFHGVDFNGVNLEGACFINASLHGVDFNASNLNGAIFTGSTRAGTDYNYTDTSGVIWDGPSECPSHQGSEASQEKEIASRPEVIKAESIKKALLSGPDSKIDLTVNFPNDSDEIKAKAHVQVLEIATAIKSPELSKKRILIEGHTDNVGGDDYNVDLSYRRAVRVMRVLIEEYDIDSIRLQVKGYGEGEPVVSNDSEKGRSINRRVTLVNMGDI